MAAHGSDVTPPRDAFWDERVLAQIDAGVDGSLVAENLRRTPTERLRRLQDWMRFLERQRDLAEIAEIRRRSRR